MALNAFISYAHGDRHIAGQVKKEFADYGINSFLAHEDVEPTVQWQTEITKNLKACTLFVPLISTRFRDSKWTDQEVGMAVAWNKKIAPLMIDATAPYGFINKYQATRIDTSNVQPQLLSVIAKLADDTKLGANVTEGLIQAFANSSNYDAAERRANAILEKANTLSTDQLNKIIEASSKNNQIFKGRNPRAIISKLIQQHPDIDAKHIERFRQATGELTLD